MYLKKIGINLFIALEWVMCKGGVKFQEPEKMKNSLTYKFKLLEISLNP